MKKFLLFFALFFPHISFGMNQKPSGLAALLVRGSLNEHSPEEWACYIHERHNRIGEGIVKPLTRLLQSCNVYPSDVRGSFEIFLKSPVGILLLEAVNRADQTKITKDQLADKLSRTYILHALPYALKLAGIQQQNSQSQALTTFANKMGYQTDNLAELCFQLCDPKQRCVDLKTILKTLPNFLPQDRDEIRIAYFFLAPTNNYQELCQHLQVTHALSITDYLQHDLDPFDHLDHTQGYSKATLDLSCLKLTSIAGLSTLIEDISSRAEDITLLNLAHNNLQSISMKEVNRLQNLQTLNLDHNDIENITVDTANNIKKLSSIMLNDNPMSVENMEKLEQSLALQGVSAHVCL